MLFLSDASAADRNRSRIDPTVIERAHFGSRRRRRRRRRPSTWKAELTVGQVARNYAPDKEPLSPVFIQVSWFSSGERLVFS